MKTLLNMLFAGTLGVVAQGAGAAPCAPADCKALDAVARDYIEGWYDGNAARMRNALSPQLAKRNVAQGADGARVEEMGADGLIYYTGKGAGATRDPALRRADVTVLDVSGDMAAVKLVAQDWVDYLALARIDGQWKIVTVVWELHPR
ncbi:Putative lumazine-binding [Andreprevotia lacus DSM 23236]|jgi:hypothetical protein|uniref:Putative lumazine-binding n=1 Tax=Andreprevotia lacus DSM 23236 TaxID=1121001 RepID=A0A1W1XU66_9NEIS|nr:nuclear transport factor 2 family protein [Andreprevotia lacus]SMC27503.1 Putative lumazine-binding [Andreprevotia lacus DSM 23236]